MLRKIRWPIRLALLIAITLAATVASEALIFNHRAFVKPVGESREVDLYLLTNDQGAYLSDGEPIRITPSENSLFVVKTEEIYEEASSLRIRLSGTSEPVEVDVELRDEASAYAYQRAYSGAILPGVEGLDTLDCALHTNGLMNALRITFHLDQRAEAEIYLEALELDPDIAVRWNVPRMLLCFAVLLAALCLYAFPWRSLIYQPENHWHRAVLMLPLIAILLFYSVLTPMTHINYKPEGENDFLWIWKPDPLAPTSTMDGYGLLFSAFLNGEVAIPIDPPEELLTLDNPYDPSERHEAGIPFLLDYALYEGKYYFYFGPGPVLLFYLPYYLLTGQMPNMLLVCMLSSMLGAAMIFWAVTGFVRRYVKRPNLILLLLSCTASAMMASGPYMAALPTRYNVIRSLNIAMMAGAIGFGYHAVMQHKQWKRIAQFLLCGLCFGLQATCCANTLLISTAVLFPPFMGVLVQRERLARKLRDAACFLVPALCFVGLVMAYNYVRFGSVAEFGQTHQLTAEDIHYNVFRMEHIPQALYYYLLDFPAVTLPFPYVNIYKEPLNLTGNALYHETVNVGILSYPLAWLCLFLPSGFRCIQDRSLRREGIGATVLGLGMALVLIVLSFYYAGLDQRYTYDMLLMFALAGSLVGLSICQSEQAHTAGSVMLLLCMLTIILGFLFGFTNVRNLIAVNCPEWFYSMVRMFFPY